VADRPMKKHAVGGAIVDGYGFTLCGHELHHRYLTDDHMQVTCENCRREIVSQLRLRKRKAEKQSTMPDSPLRDDILAQRDGYLRLDAIQAFQNKGTLLYVSSKRLSKHDIPVRVAIRKQRAG